MRRPVALAGWVCAGLLAWLAAGFARAGLPETIERVKPSIVAVGSFQRTRNPSFAFRGTGFAVGDGSLIATNAHVLPETLQGEQREVLAIAVAANAGQEAQVREVKTVTIDRDHDLALLRLTGAPLPPLAIRGAGLAREGETYLFAGFPIGSVLGLFPVTHRAMIASVSPIALPGAGARQLDEKLIRRLKSGTFAIYQLDATAYPGSSGSPLFDPETAEVVGVINMVFVKGTKEAALSQPSGISFAIPGGFLAELIRTAR